jgi:heterodisulfide reductase subunit A
MPRAPRPEAAGQSPHPAQNITLAQPWASSLAVPLKVAARAVILAPGYTPFDPRRKTRFGHGRVPGVVSALELEEALALGHLDPVPGRVAFIQCVGSRDHELGRPYCSRVCCAYALRLARLLKHRAPQTQVTFFHMDTQGYGRAWEDELPGLRRELRFVRAMPGEVTAGPGGAEVVWAGPEGAPAREEFDLVALSVGLGPGADADSLASLFQTGRTADGFLGLEGQAVAAAAPGVFLAGAARGPMSISEAIAHATLAAAAAAIWAGEEHDV